MADQPARSSPVKPALDGGQVEMLEHRSPVRAMGEDRGLVKLGYEVYHLLLVQAVAGLDRRLTGHGGQDILHAGGGPAACLGQGLGKTDQDALDDLTGLKVAHDGRHRLDHIGVTTKGLHGKTQAGKVIGMIFQDGPGRGVWFQHLRKKQDLAGNAGAAVLLLQGLEEDALLQGMLINGHQTVRGFTEDIGVVQLADEPKTRQGGRGCAGRRWG